MIFEIDIDRVAAGGDGIGTAPDGRVTFVPGSMPGDRLTVEPIQQKKSFVRARLLAVVEPAPGRVSPPCPHVAEGCGGCDWQHITPATQTDLRLDLVHDALRRIARFDDAQRAAIDIAAGPSLDPSGYRTTARLISNGRGLGFRRQQSHDVVVPDHCLVLHPALDALVGELDAPTGVEVTARVGERTGERLVHVHGEGLEVSRPDGVVLSTDDAPASISEVVAGHEFVVSGSSFFQCRPDGAEAMVELVGSAIADSDGPLVDAYAGVGLFGATLGADRVLTSIESNPSSVADSRHNLPTDTTILEMPVEAWDPTPAAAVIADPARSGLGVDGVRVLAGAGAEVIALVSCDVAAMGRDLGLLHEAGYEVDWIRTLDLFGMTSHVEIVSRLVRR